MNGRLLTNPTTGKSYTSSQMLKKGSQNVHERKPAYSVSFCPWAKDFILSND
jgi:hypothetical protein